MSMPNRPNRRSYPSDLTDEEWDIIADMIPVPFWRPTLQEPLHHPREMLDAIRYRTRTGCSWRLLPHDFPPWQTVYRYFALWRDDGTVDLVHDTLRDEVRTRSKRRAGGTREATPSAGIVEPGPGDLGQRGQKGRPPGERRSGRHGRQEQGAVAA